MKLAQKLINMHEKFSDKTIKEMIKAIKDEDEKKLLKFMAMDKKNKFSKIYLDNRVEDGEITRNQASKLGKLAIGVALALSAMDDSSPPEKREAARKRALERVKEAEAVK